MPVRPRFWHWPGSKVQIAKGWAWTGSCFGQTQLSAGGGGGGGGWPWPWSDRWSDPTGGQTAWFIALPCSHPPFLFLRDCNELGAVEQCNCIGNCMRASYYEGSRIVLRSTWRWVVNTYIDKVFKSNPAKYFDSVHFVVAWNSNDLPERQVLAIRPLVAVFLFMLIPPPSQCLQRYPLPQRVLRFDFVLKKIWGGDSYNIVPPSPHYGDGFPDGFSGRWVTWGS